MGMIKKAAIIVLMLSISALASDNGGSVFFGKNLAKPASEHSDRLYLRIDDSEKLYFNRKCDGPVLENLDLNDDHIVKVYFDDEVGQSWTLNFSRLEARSVVIWRSAGAWRMEPIQ
jgi:hypothetical protein